MKSLPKLLTLLVLISMLMSCSEDNGDFLKPATIKVVHLINGIDNVIVKTGTSPINYTTTNARVHFNESKNFSIAPNVNEDIEIVSESDVLTPIYSESLNLKSGIHSLYLSGFVNDYDNLLVEDKFKQFKDSIVGIRFINLSKASGLVDIRVTGDSNAVVSGLGFQTVTDYIEFPAKESDGGYRFEFRDSSDNLLFVYRFSPLSTTDVSTKKNLTLVFIELKDLQYDVLRVNNY